VELTENAIKGCRAVASAAADTRRIVVAEEQADARRRVS
tara:strand:- start:694 stop:810 length:117 start_codon:yes stop_codon:yes gene_type:complete